MPCGVNGNGTALPGFPRMAWTGFYPDRWGKSRTFTWDTPLHIYGLAKGVPELSKLDLRGGIMAGLKAGNDKLTDGLGVSPPAWWMKGM